MFDLAHDVLQLCVLIPDEGAILETFDTFYARHLFYRLGRELIPFASFSTITRWIRKISIDSQ